MFCPVVNGLVLVLWVGIQFPLESVQKLFGVPSLAQLNPESVVRLVGQFRLSHRLVLLEWSCYEVLLFSLWVTFAAHSKPCQPWTTRSLSVFEDSWSCCSPHSTTP